MEMLVVIAMISVVLTMATTTLATLFRVQQQFTFDLNQDTTLTRLSSLWRADAHMAVEASVDQRCELVMADGRRVRYAIGPREITREVARDQNIVHRDAFRLPPNAAVKITSAEESGASFVRLSITPGNAVPRAHLPPVRSVTMAAALNLYKQPAATEDAR